MTRTFEVTSAAHVPDCSPLETPAVPFGNEHYGTWADFRAYEFPIPAGFLIHSMEHGAVVFYYNCPAGCASELEELRKFIASLPEDPMCAGTSTLRRVISVPNPDLPSRFAAAAWGATLQSDCFDAAEFRNFYTEHYARGPEDFCSAGTVFNQPPCR